MLNTISTLVFDPDGYVEIMAGDEAPSEVRRRSNRVATLDGGAAINDFGFSHADRTITLRWTVTQRATEAAVDRLVQTYNRLVVSTRAGVFLAAPEVYAPGPAESTLRLLALAKLSI
jgi:hypothetical protein